MRAYRTHSTDGFCGIAGRVCAQRHARGCRLRLAAKSAGCPTCPSESAARLCQNESAGIWRGSGIRALPARAGFRAAHSGFANAVWAGGRLRRKRFGGGYAGRCRAEWFLLRGVRAWWRHEGKILGVGLLRGRQPENEIQAVIKFSL